MKKKLYLVQIAISLSSPCFLPYAMGCIAAYLRQDREITDLYEIPDIVAMREPVEKVLSRIVDPDLVAVSNVLWNTEYNKILVRELKKRYPDVTILFGGHGIPHNCDYLADHPDVDYVTYYEGEKTMARLLKALAHGEALDGIPNLAFRKDGKTVRTETAMQQELSDLPSPYLTGEFDHLMEEFPDTEFHAIIETNRGCPYRCAFCEWCFTKNVRAFPMEKVKKEIEWVSAHHLKYAYCADSNFGILERDVEIAEYVVEMRDKYGAPDIFKPCYAKISEERVFQAGYILNKNKVDKGVTLTYQSSDPTTLRNIGRKNLTFEEFKSLNDRFTAEGIPTYTEFILGLPGETYESFCRGICDLLEYGQNNSMMVYECQVYPNALVADPEYKKKHGIITAKVPLFSMHYNPDNSGVQEYFEIIIGTDTMPVEDWVRSFIFSVILQAFHHMGLLRFFAIYLNREKHVSYYDFYHSLLRFIYEESAGFMHGLFEDLSARKRDTEKADWTFTKEIYGPTGWYFEEGAFLELARSGDVFWNEILPFLKKFGVEEPLFSQLFEFQKKLVRLPDGTGADIDSDWNFYPYFTDNSGQTPLRRVRSHFHAVSDTVVHTWAQYAKQIIWFGKRHSMTLYINEKETPVYTEEND